MDVQPDPFYRSCAHRVIGLHHMLCHKFSEDSLKNHVLLSLAAFLGILNKMGWTHERKTLHENIVADQSLWLLDSAGPGWC